MWRERALIVLMLLFHRIDGGDGCSPSSCGKIRNISYPFRLKGDLEGCGPFELSCENNITLLSLFSGSFHVETINYNNFTIRVVDPGLQPTNCSSPPRYFLSPSNFSDFDADALRPYEERYIYVEYYDKFLYEYILFLDCSHPVSGNRKYVNTGGCVNWESKGYIYAMAGDLLTKDLEVGCQVKLVAPTSWWGLDTNNYSYAMMHTALLYGFQLSWIHLVCEDRCAENDYCYFSSNHTLQCWPWGQDAGELRPSTVLSIGVSSGPSPLTLPLSRFAINLTAQAVTSTSLLCLTTIACLSSFASSSAVGHSCTPGLQSCSLTAGETNINPHRCR